ncbi:hypothetical protein TNCV_4809801 [Trichonephila clavipes]|nr:hypothetical protein TNCV_4809801 [Trichonephila clavipes]
MKLQGIELSLLDVPESRREEDPLNAGPAVEKGIWQRSCRARQGAEIQQRLPRRRPFYSHRTLKEHVSLRSTNKRITFHTRKEVTIFKIEHRTESIRQEEAREHYDEMAGSIDIIEPSSSPWVGISNRLGLVRKMAPLTKILRGLPENSLTTRHQRKTAFTSGQGLCGQFAVSAAPPLQCASCHFRGAPDGDRAKGPGLLGGGSCLILPDDVIIGGRTFERNTFKISGKVLSKLSDANSES